MCNHDEILNCEKWYEHKPEPITEAKGVTILGDLAVQMSKNPGVVVNDYKRKSCLLIDMAVSTNNNILVKEYDEISRYKDLEIEIEKIWHLKTTIVPVIVGALGIIKKGTDKHINKIPDSPGLYKIQKNCTLWNCSSPQVHTLKVTVAAKKYKYNNHYLSSG